MPDAVTVVISAAGLGTRLGLNVPKALVEVAGEPVLKRQLAELRDVRDVVVVAGYRSQLVLDLLRELRPDVRVALNHEFSSTGTAASLARAAAVAEPWIVSLDGDLLTRARDLRAVLEHPRSCLGITTVRSEQPVWATVDGGDRVVDLSDTVPASWEWSGLAKIERDVALELGTQHVFQGLLPHLPMDAIVVDCVEIDELADLQRAEAWVRGSAGGH